MKTRRRVNAAIAIYYGIGSVLVSLGGMAFFFVGLYKSITGSPESNWGMTAAGFITAIVMGIIGYALIKVANEQSE